MVKRLLAVTICVNYADYLECVIRNREHFDRWVIVTAQADKVTQELCARHGLECIPSTVLREDGGDFHAAHHKGAVLNEGLNALCRTASGTMVEDLDPEAWVVVLDADILLPRHFGERVRAMPLKAGCLYALAGRKLCETRAQFEAVRDCEPWEFLVARYSQALGFFNLFCLGERPNRYPVREAGSGEEHDDYLFTTSFPPELRKILPMTCIHAGPKAVNWARRTSPCYRGREGRELDFSGSGHLALPSSARAAVLGYFPGGQWLDAIGDGATIYLADHYHVRAVSPSALLEADRAVLRAGMAEDLATLKNTRVYDLPPSSDLTEIADESLDLLYLSGEASPAQLCAQLPQWLPKLKDGARIRGEIYGLPHWPETTYAITLLLGTPEVVTQRGRWEIRYQKALGHRLHSGEEGRAASEGVVFVSSGKQAISALLVSLYAARQAWPGPLAVWHHGEEDEPLRIACSLLGAALWHVSLDEAPMEALLLEVRAALPFEQALVLQAGDLLLERPAFPDENAIAAGTGVSLPAVLRQNRRNTKLANPPNGPGRLDSLVHFLAPPAGERASRHAVMHAKAQTYTAAEPAKIVICRGNPETWSTDAWRKWCEAEAWAAVQVAGTIRVPKDATVVSIIGRNEMANFQRSSWSWRFPKGTPIRIVLAGVDRSAFWWPETLQNFEILELSEKEADDLPGLLQAIADRCPTPRVILLPPDAAALPGAALWPGETSTQMPLAMHLLEAAQTTKAATGNAFVPRCCFGLVSVEELRECARHPGADRCRYDQLAALLYARITEHPGADASWFSDLSKQGWNFPRAHLFLDPEGAWRKRCDRPEISERSDGLLQLAEDTVVISLPERLDRRARITAMMARERIAFRFADGVRVRPEEIQPSEIAEVYPEGFKLKAGFDRYLCGMVGCRRAHLRVLQQAKALRLSSLLVIEDDMHLWEGWQEILERSLAELPEGWMQLHFSTIDFHRAETFSPHLKCLGGSYQATAILYSAAGIAAAANCLQQSRSEIDHWLGVHLHPFGNSFAVVPSISYQRGGHSDIMGFDRGITS